ncbi:hypothetical protein ACWET9_24850 [Streptomyces sp. NPDC004059]
MTTNPTVDGPFPIRVNATQNGAELDLSAFLISAVFTELITKAYEDPEGFAAELADLYEVYRSAAHQGRDSHARHEFDTRMQALVAEFANDGMVPLYRDQVARMRDRLDQIAAPRPVPAQHQAGAA